MIYPTHVALCASRGFCSGLLACRRTSVRSADPLVHAQRDRCVNKSPAETAITKHRLKHALIRFRDHSGTSWKKSTSFGGTSSWILVRVREDVFVPDGRLDFDGSDQVIR